MVVASSLVVLKEPSTFKGGSLCTHVHTSSYVGLDVHNLIYKFTTSVCLWQKFWGVREGGGPVEATGDLSATGNRFHFLINCYIYLWMRLLLCCSRRLILLCIETVPRRQDWPGFHQWEATQGVIRAAAATVQNIKGLHCIGNNEGFVQVQHHSQTTEVEQGKAGGIHSFFSN